MKCATCGQTFTPTRSDSRYCSNRCRQEAYRARKRKPDVSGDKGYVSSNIEKAHDEWVAKRGDGPRLPSRRG